MVHRDGEDDAGDTNLTVSGEAKTFTGVQEMISVPDRDLSPAEMQRIMRQVACVTGFLASSIIRHASQSKDDRAPGLGHPICQSILNCSLQADTAAIQLAGPPQIMQPQQAPVRMPPRRN